MATAIIENPAWLARWHRQTAADLESIGRSVAARARIEKAKLCEAQIGSTACSECSRPLTDPVSIDLGVGPECRAKVEAASGVG